MAICDTVFCDHVADGSLSRFTSLSTRLPFEDDTFDLVHVSHISKGVPEHKVKVILIVHTVPPAYGMVLQWSSLFEVPFLTQSNSLPAYHGFRKYAG
jgi:hypothetical protein